MGYRNQPIIQDADGLMAMARENSKLTNVILTSVEKNAQFMRDQKKISDAKQEKFDLAFNQHSVTQFATLNEKLDKMRTAGNKDDIIKDYQNEQKKLMQGYTDTDGNHVIGSIEAAAILGSRSVSEKERTLYQDTIFEADTNLSKTVKEAAVLLTDIAVIKEKALLGSGPGHSMHWFGDGLDQQLGSQLAGMALANLDIEGVTVNEKGIKRVKVGDKYSNILTIKSTLSANDPLLKGMDLDNNKYITKNKDGTVTYTFTQDMTDWDGDLLSPTEEATDTNKLLIDKNILVKKPGGEGINPTLTTLMPATTVNTGQGYEQLTQGEFVDVTKINQTYEESLTGRIASLMTLKPNGMKAYLEQRLGLGEVNIVKFAQLTGKAKENMFKELELNYMREKHGLNVGDSLIKGYQMVERKLTAGDVKWLNKQGIEGSHIAEGKLGLFQQKITSQKDGSQTGKTEMEKFNKLQKSFFNEPNPEIDENGKVINKNTNGNYISTIIQGKKGTGFGVVRIQWTGDVWQPQKMESESVTVSKGGGSASTTGQIWVNDDSMKAYKDKDQYKRYLSW